jgi:hypothetical protein
MSLVKKPIMTEKKVDASRRNGGLSQGPVTKEGKGRIGAAQLRHGFYAKAQEAALRRLGEDPAHFEELLAGLRQEFTPAGTLQDELVVRLARVLWQMDRADRSQEGEALCRAKSVDSGRENRLHARMMRLKMTAGSLQSLARSVAREHYVTRPRDLELMKTLQQDRELEEMGEIALALFCQLQDPGAYDEAGRPVDSQEAQQKVLIRIKEIFGLAGDHPYQPNAASSFGSVPDGHPGAATGTEGADAPSQAGAKTKPDPYPHITAADWEAREPVRQLLENILARQAELFEALRQAILKETLAGPSPYERAAEFAPSHADALLMRRIQDANMREVRRLTNLLLKIQRRERKMEALERNDDALLSHDILENKDT